MNSSRHAGARSEVAFCEDIFCFREQLHVVPDHEHTHPIRLGDMLGGCLANGGEMDIVREPTLAEQMLCEANHLVWKRMSLPYININLSRHRQQRHPDQHPTLTTENVQYPIVKHFARGYGSRDSIELDCGHAHYHFAFLGA